MHHGTEPQQHDLATDLFTYDTMQNVFAKHTDMSTAICFANCWGALAPQL